jgi:DNA-nicking Smr family endonuclease
VQSWLIQKNQVLAFVQATPSQGGAGALVVLLQGGAARLVRAEGR